MAEMTNDEGHVGCVEPKRRRVRWPPKTGPVAKLHMTEKKHLGAESF